MNWTIVGRFEVIQYQFVQLYKYQLITLITIRVNIFYIDTKLIYPLVN
jgi:hypothetical protein